MAVMLIMNKHYFLITFIGIIVLIFSLSIISYYKSDSSSDIIVFCSSYSDNDNLYESSFSTDTYKVKETKTAKKKNKLADSSKKCSQESSVLTTASMTENLMVNLNTADISELSKLNGIGETLAERIINYRTINGIFKNIEEIKNVDGIGEAKFSAICNNIYVDNPTYELQSQTVENNADEQENSDVQIQEQTESSHEEVNSNETSQVTTMTIDDIAPLNLNTATKEQLMLLPHVNDKIADEIIDLRQKIKKFKNSYELCYVESLTESDVSDIIKYIVVE